MPYRNIGFNFPLKQITGKLAPRSIAVASWNSISGRVPEFQRNVHELLRQPLENGLVKVSRALATVVLYGPISPCSNQALIVVGVNVAPRGDAVRIAKIRLSYMQGIFSQSRRPCEMKNFALTNFAERCSIHFGPEYRNHPGRAGVLGPGIAAKSNSVHFQAVRLMRMIFNNSLFDGLIPRASPFSANLI